MMVNPSMIKRETSVAFEKRTDHIKRGSFVKKITSQHKLTMRIMFGFSS